MRVRSRSGDEMYARQLAGIDQVALDAAARQGFALGEFEDSEEDGASVLEEFYSTSGEMQGNGDCEPEAVQMGKSVLADKLRQRTAKSPSAVAMENDL